MKKKQELKKQKVTVVRKLYDIDDCTVKELSEKLQKEQLIFEEGNKGIKDIRFTYKSEDDYGSITTQFYLEGQRDETDAEFVFRISLEAKYEVDRKKLYEELKKEFENE